MTTQREYWRFYWPLALTGLALLLARQFQNGALARFPEASYELAIWAYAIGTFFLFHAALVFVPQMVNVIGRSAKGRRYCLFFTLAASIILTIPAALITYTPLGNRLIGSILAIEGRALADVLRYLQYLMPLIIIDGLRHYYTGLLVQAHFTGAVTVFNIAHLAAVIATLTLGFAQGWDAVETLALALVSASLLNLVLTLFYYIRFYRPGDDEPDTDVSFHSIFRYFWPVALTSTMFALSRPSIYAFAGRLDQGETTVAALRVAFDFVMIFQKALNEFRHLYATFGRQNLHSSFRFSLSVTLTITGLMLVVAFTPLGLFVFSELLGVQGIVLDMVRHIFLILCFVPLVLNMRNYYHGIMLVHGQTRGMAAGGIMRVVVIYTFAWGAYTLGALDHSTAALILLFGFAIEAAVCYFGSRSVRY